MGSYHRFTKFCSDGPDLRSGPDSVEKTKLIAIFRLDHHIRLLAQREESLSYKAKALKKTTDLTNDTMEVEEFDSKIRRTQAQRVKDEYTMFRLVSELPLFVKNLYYRLRLDPLWYMREEMVQDCAGRGGCCSRECGCCAQRSLSERTKTRGHCTMECWCCRSFRNPSLTEEDQTFIALDLEKLMESNNHIANMANWYFRPRKHRAARKVKSGLKRMVQCRLYSK